MKLDDLRNLESGTELLLSNGNGWYSKVAYQRLIKVTSFPPTTFSELMSGSYHFDINNGKAKMEALVIDEKGKDHIVSARRLQRIHY